MVEPATKGVGSPLSRWRGLLRRPRRLGPGGAAVAAVGEERVAELRLAATQLGEAVLVFEGPPEACSGSVGLPTGAVRVFPQVREGGVEAGDALLQPPHEADRVGRRPLAGAPPQLDRGAVDAPHELFPKESTSARNPSPASSPTCTGAAPGDPSGRCEHARSLSAAPASARSA